MKRWMCVCVGLAFICSPWFRFGVSIDTKLPLIRCITLIAVSTMELISHQIHRETYVRKSTMRKSRFMPWQEVF